MVKDWTPEQRENLIQLGSALAKMEMINRTTGVISDIQSVSELSKKLLYTREGGDNPTFWEFLIQELNKE